MSEIIKTLEKRRAEYLEAVKECASAPDPNPEYWAGKASGLMLAIEVLQEANR